MSKSNILEHSEPATHKLDLSRNPQNDAFDAQIHSTPLNPVVRLRGKVVPALKRGSKYLSTPTANLDPAAFTGKIDNVQRGVLFGFAQIEQGPVYPAMLSLGTNPTFETDKESLEVYINHDYNNDFYDSEMSVIIVGYLRPQEKFDSTEELMKWIARDVRVANRELTESKEYQQFSKDSFFHQIKQ